ncbi:jg21379 [Pararge aegeria aegeria]|uniref:Jg21379 protein n=1 Tax=Pararge aegeria aegeria TaxID=348720 RepID=A0A8S4RWV9_9NEOP|nr:jg21379 [Pararge aegeria aegeria]
MLLDGLGFRETLDKNRSGDSPVCWTSTSLSRAEFESQHAQHLELLQVMYVLSNQSVQCAAWGSVLDYGLNPFSLWEDTRAL